MIKIPDNIHDLNSYKPGKPIAQIVSDLGLKKWAVLWNNENNLGVSKHVQQRVSDAVANSHLYPDPTCKELRESIARLNKRKVEEVAVANGSEELLFNLNKAFMQGDDELLTVQGTFVAIYIWAKAANVPVVKVPLAKDYGFDLDQLFHAIDERTKLIYLSNPNNPTGSMIPAEDLREFIERVPKHILVVVDEAYFEYAAHIPSYPNTAHWNYENLITLRTFSKAYGVAGIRLGYGIGNSRLIEALNKVRMTFAPSNVAQAAGVAAIEDTNYLERAIANNKAGLALMEAALKQKGMTFIPSAANFITIAFDHKDLASAFTQYCYNQGVFIRQLSAFGIPECVRVSIGRPEENALFVEVLEGFKA